MSAGPSQRMHHRDCQERENSLLLKKIQDGKMEGPERAASSEKIQPHDVTKEFDAILLDEGKCRRWFLKKLYPASPSCPSCNCILTKKQQDIFFMGRRVICKGCGRWFNERSGTMLSGTHMTYGQIVLLMLLLGLKQPARLISHMLGCDEDTVRSWRNKLTKEN